MMKYLPTIVLLGVQLFFSISAIIGYQYMGSDSSSIYIVYNVVLFILTIIIFFCYSFKKKFIFYKNQIVVLLLPFIITILYLIEHLFGNVNELATTRYMYFILWSVPAILMGIILSENKRYKYFFKSLDIIMLIFSLATFSILFSTFTTNVRASIGGASYQYAGYVIALTFGLNLYLQIYRYSHERYNFTKLKIYRILCYFLLIIQLAGVIITGARGPMVLVIIYILFILGISFYKPGQLFKLLISIIGIILVIGLLWPTLVEITIFENSWNRAFAYISADGINWDGTSGRGSIYINSLEKIIESPLYGYGFFGMWRVLNRYPHNLVLEVLLQGGIILLLFYFILFFLFLNKLLNITKANKEIRIILILFIYSLTLLMFSGTYIHEVFLWFCFSFVLSYKKFKY